MKAITYAKAHFFHSSEAICKLALKGRYDINKARAEISDKLRVVDNSDKKRVDKYAQQLKMLNASGSSQQPTESDTDKPSQQRIKLSSTIFHPVAALRSVSPRAMTVESVKGANKTLSPLFFNELSSPAQLKIQVENLKENISRVIRCSDINQINQSKMLRSITTNLKYLSEYSVDNDHKEKFPLFLQQKVASQHFSTFGDQDLTDDKQLQFVKAHLMNIQRWINQETTAVCEGSSTA